MRNKQEIIQELERRGVVVPAPVEGSPNTQPNMPTNNAPVESVSQQPSRDQIIQELQRRGVNPQEEQEEFINVGEKIGEQLSDRPWLPPNVKEAIGNIGRESPDIAGGIAGGMAGFKAGSRFGIPGAITGGVLGSVFGATAGKEAQQAAGLQEDQTLTTNILESAKEEAIGRGLTMAAGVTAKVASPVVSPAIKKAKEFFGIDPEKPVKDLFLSSEIFDPSNATPRNIIEAQDNILNERMLTTFEETGGRADLGRMSNLTDRVKKTVDRFMSDSAFLKNRDIINQRMNKALNVGDFQRIDKVMGESVKNSFNQALKRYDPAFKKINSELMPLRNKVKIPLGDTRALIESKRDELSQSVGEEPANKIIDTILEKLPKRDTGFGGEQISNTITLKKLNEIDNAIKNKLPKFSPSKDVQDKLAGAYTGNIMPILHGVKTQTLKNNPGNKQLARALELEATHAKLAADKGRIVNSKIGKALGLTEDRQLQKAVRPSAVVDKVFESPQSWKQTREILQGVNPELIQPLQQAFKVKNLENVMSESGEVSLSKLNSLIKTKRDVISEIDGGEYLKTLDDARLISAALATTKDIGSGSLGSLKVDDLAGPVLREVVNPLNNRVNLVSAIMTRVKSGLGMGKLSDKDLFKTLKGEKGQKTLSQLENVFLDDPEAYNTYVQFFREAKKVNDSLEDPVTKGDFTNLMNTMLRNVESVFPYKSKNFEEEQPAQEKQSKAVTKQPKQLTLADRIAESLASRNQNA